MLRNVVVALVLFGACGFGHCGENLSYVDVINQLADLESLAVLPEAGEGCAQFSGYDRKSKYDPVNDKYVGWEANDDWTGYIRKEGENYVLAEMNGPGVIWRIWSAKAGEGNVKVFLDGKESPAIDMPFAKFFDGTVEPFNKSELVNTLAMGLNCYVPILYQKSCKIIADKNWPYVVLPDKEKGVFYHFTYSTFPKGTKVETFKLPLSKEQKAALNNMNEVLGKCGVDPAGKRKGETAKKKTITVGAGKTVKAFDIEGEWAITALKVKPKFEVGPEDHDTLRKVCLSIYWDVDVLPAVWSPIGDFFGTGPGENHYKSLTMGMTDEGYYSYWYMPFAKRALIELTNDGKEDYSFDIEITYSKPNRPIEKLGRFHAKWHRDAWLPRDAERRAIDWTMLKAQGRGRYCGVMLHVWHPRGGWWGEGDEKIYVDGEKFPSTFGTGSEDYFGYAWCIPSLFENCFHNQTHSNQPVGEKPDPHEGNRGHISVNRWHVADNIPFQKSFDAAIEKYCNNNFPTLYAATAYWYQAAGEVDAYPIVPIEERVGYWHLPEAKKVEGVIEGEEMKVLSVSKGSTAAQDLGMFGKNWSGDKQLWWTGAQIGDVLELGFKVDEEGEYKIEMQFTKAIDYGTFEMSIDNNDAFGKVDLFSADVTAFKTDAYDIGHLGKGRHKLKVKVVGSNELALKSYMFGLDYIKLVKIK